MIAAEPTDGGESGLRAHAARELTLAGLFDPNSDYGGAIATQVMELVTLFASQGHSGFSAQLTLDVFNIVARYRTLTPNTHTLYVDVSEACGAPAGTVLQDARDSRYFSRDAGVTWYSVEDRERTPESEEGTP